MIGIEYCALRISCFEKPHFECVCVRGGVEREVQSVRLVRVSLLHFWHGTKSKLQLIIQ